MRRSVGAERRSQTIATPTITSVSFRTTCGFTIGLEKNAAFARARLKELPSATVAPFTVLLARNERMPVFTERALSAYACTRTVNTVYYLLRFTSSLNRACQYPVARLRVKKV